MTRPTSQYSLALVTTALLLVPSAIAQGNLAVTVDDHIGQLRAELDAASATYGDRPEFDAAQHHLTIASRSLLSAAVLLAEDSLILTAGALETGRARAESPDHPDPTRYPLERAAAIANTAQTDLVQIRSDLQSLERAPLDATTFDGLLGVARTVLRALDLLRQHELNWQQWNDGANPTLSEQGAVSAAAGARLLADLARDQLRALTARQAQADPVVTLDTADLEQLAARRAEWAGTHPTHAAAYSQSRVQQFHADHEHLMTVAAFYLWIQDVAFNGLYREVQFGTTLDAFEEAWRSLNETAPRIETGLQQLGVPGDLAIGALGSAGVTLGTARNLTGQAQDQYGAMAGGYVFLATEHWSVLSEAFLGQGYVPGTLLAETWHATPASGFTLPPWSVVLLAVGAVLLGGVVIIWRIRR